MSRRKRSGHLLRSLVRAWRLGARKHRQWANKPARRGRVVRQASVEYGGKRKSGDPIAGTAPERPAYVAPKLDFAEYGAMVHSHAVEFRMWADEPFDDELFAAHAHAAAVRRYGLHARAWGVESVWPVGAKAERQLESKVHFWVPIYPS